MMEEITKLREARLWHAQREALQAALDEAKDRAARLPAEAERAHVELEAAKERLRVALEVHDVAEAKFTALAEQVKRAKADVQRLQAELRLHVDQKPPRL